MVKSNTRCLSSCGRLVLVRGVLVRGVLVRGVLVRGVLVRGGVGAGLGGRWTWWAVEPGGLCCFCVKIMCLCVNDVQIENGCVFGVYECNTL
jgi:hypothetical protein